MQKKYLTSYGRVNARKLTNSQRVALEQVMGEFNVNPSSPELLAILGQSPDGNNKIPLKSLEDSGNGFGKVILEIGFGMGEHIAHRAKNDPQTLYIGCEPFNNGVARLSAEIQKDNLANIRIYQGDARELIEGFADDSVDKIFLMHPDPWPKAKHHKRRIVNAQSLEMFARILKPQGQMQVATDWQDYAKWILRHFLDCSHFKWLVQSKADWENEPEGHIQTKYQKKSLKEGRKAVFMLFEKTN